MIYKLQTGGIIKLQNAGSVPQIDNTRVSKPLMKYQKSTIEQDHDALVKWNLEHPDDKVYRIEDLIQKEKEANPSWIRKIANMEIEVPAMTGPAAGWNPAFMSQLPKVKSTVGKELGYTMGLLTAPALLSELGTYGLIGGGLRLTAGSAAAAGASYVGGKQGGIIKGQNGIPEINGGQIFTTIVTPRGNYTKYTGEEQTIPSKEQFINAKREEARINAVYNMLGASSPHVPSIKIPSRNILSIIAGKLGMSDEERIKMWGLCTPYTCISHATFTGYGPDNEAISNEEFMKNPAKYGFIKTKEGIKDAKPGDLVQFVNKETYRPDHAAIVTGNNGEMPTLTYSRGSVNAIHEDGESNMIYDNDRWSNNVEHSLSDGYIQWVPYRFMGNEKNIRDWLQEYNKLYNE